MFITDSLLYCQSIPDHLLLGWQIVELSPIQQIIGQAGRRALRKICREEVINQREIMCEATVLCKNYR